MAVNPNVNPAASAQAAEAERARPMFGADAIWQRLDSAGNPLVVTALAITGPLSLAALRERVASRLGGIHRFRCRPLERSGLWFWEPCPAFSWEGRVRSMLAAEPGQAEADSWQAQLEHCINSRLPAEQPGWEILWQPVRDRQGQSAVALLFRVHHCYADGLSLVHLLESLCDQPPLTMGKRASPGLPIWRKGLNLLAELAELAAQPADPVSALRPAANLPFTRKRCALSSPLSEVRLRHIARALSCSVNDLLLAAVGGGLRHWLLAQGADVPAGIHASVPVYVGRNAHLQSPGNHIGMVFVPLSPDLGHPLERLYHTKHEVLRRRHSALPQLSHWAMILAGCLPGAWQARVLQMLGDRASLVVSNVRGPRSRLCLLGEAVRELMFWVPCGGRIGLGISLINYAGQVQIGLSAESGLVADAEELLEEILLSLEEYGRYTGEPAPGPLRLACDVPTELRP